MSKKIYIAGPMRGIPYYNAPLFDKVASQLLLSGAVVINPVARDRDAGFDVYQCSDDHDWSTFPKQLDRKAVAKRSILDVAEADSVCCLPGWENSQGANSEVMFALFSGLDVWEWGSPVASSCVFGSIKSPRRAEILTKAIELTCGERDEKYGEPVRNMQHIADIANAILQRDLTAYEITVVHESTKLARRRTSPTESDHYADGAAYTGIAYECQMEAIR